MRAKNRQSHVHQERLQIDGREVAVGVKSNPRARRLTVKVHPMSGEVTVVTPGKLAPARALEFARGEKDWIARQLARVPPRIVFQVGARIPLRGEEHVIVRAETGAVAADGAVIRVGGGAEHVGRRVADFLKQRARQELAARALEFAARIGARPHRVAVRDTMSRWGSCSATGMLSFSWRLILAPPDVADFVVAHEVAHLKEMNHGAEFRRLVRELVGDVKRPHDWLKRHGAGLHRYTAR